MLKRQHLVRSTLTVAMLSAAVLVQPAHAGLLAGLGGGGGLSGGFGPRGMDIGGSAAGQITRNGTPLPRADKAVQKAGAATEKAGAATRPSATAAGDASATSAGQSATAAGSAATRAGTAAVDATAHGARGQGADASAEGSVSR